ncbi:PREDICTED: uncharacterized protein LOC104823728 [Tarenaya hassleriana]|uniref:uncharacterized protein LOC104823728 n=1 Tax=Tarenaya hassleriana TaxID=28532 RepID=UPI00053C3737|nr:PREDICTED: uncharacterized protein LOC104823728 [Tarenaya hassleriana]XP_010553730.1 PREDICTED: uncharacterized protein LOC104823728 [Tarenaya hassleriana]XP_010553731.1 PREDICTED: uncharacterized protein LOC104823728 [Tarenaya hassleriana]
MVGLSDDESNPMEQTYYPEDSSDVEYACGDPQVDPRVGDEYQVEIPPLMSESERASLLLNPVASDIVSDSSSYSFCVGKPVQVIWIDSGTGKHGYEQGLEDSNVDMNESLRSLKAKGTRSCLKIRGQADGSSESTTEKKKTSNLEAVPGKSAESWEVSEVESFVLGLYTFGKNFTQVKKFMENKEIGEILLFYYGKFYRSAKYRSWSDSRKKRNRKCVCGMKLYSGWRQQQLLSRLIPNLPDESQKDKLVNVSKSFAEGHTSLENYIISLKEIVGLGALVDAMAIGKVKEDLTIVATEPVRTKQWFTVSSNSSASACAGAYASLTSGDIVKELTGGSRLSKARCNDIFWEAVWPRLLARGWHSEQPKDRGYVTSKDYLVFLVPGVKKFSRRKLVRGEHYFDSVSDILKKVASDPELLEFEAGGEVRPGNELVAEDSSDPSDQELSLRDSQRHRYLKSPGSNRRDLRMKFTVVDTSLDGGGKLCELRELRNLDMESPVPGSALSRGEIGVSVSGNVPDKSEPEKACEMIPVVDGKKHVKGVDGRKTERRRANNLVDDPMKFTIVDTSLDHGGKSSGLRKWTRLPGEEDLSNTSKGISREVSSGDSMDGSAKTRDGFEVKTNKNPFENLNSRENLMDRDRSKRVIKHKFIRRAESNDHTVNSVPLLKRRRLSACVRREISRSGENASIKPSESDQIRLCCPDIPSEVRCQDSSREEMNHKNEEKSETVFSMNIDSKPDETEEPVSGQYPFLKIQDDGDIRPNGFSWMLDSDKNCFSKEQGTLHEPVPSEQQEQTNRFCSVSDLDKKCSSKDLGTSQEQGQLIQPLSMPKLENNCSSKELGTSHEPHSSSEQKQEQEQEQEHQINTDVPRRQSTRKRPLTTRALEALESGFFTTKKMRSMTKPRKRENSPKKKQPAKARDRASVSDSRIPDSEHRADRNVLSKKATTTTSKLLDQIEDAQPSFLLKKGTTVNKPLNQIEDSRPVIPEVPRLPPIVWKLPPKRDSEATRN